MKIDFQVEVRPNFSVKRLCEHKYWIEENIEQTATHISNAKLKNILTFSQNMFLVFSRNFLLTFDL